MNIMKRIRSTQEGFTLIELLIVIVILGVLAAIIVPRMTNLTERARVSAGESSLRSIYNALEMHKADKGLYPANLELLDEYIENMDNVDTFLGEWDQIDTGAYTVATDHEEFTSVRIKHETDSIWLRLNSNGTIEMFDNAEPNAG